MKNVIRKNLIMALLALPMLSTATTYTDCGVGTISSLIVRHDGNVGIEINFIAKNPGTGYHEHSNFMYTGVAPQDTAGVRSTLLSAFHAGSVVQFFGSDGMCLNRIVAIGICDSSSTCGVSNHMFYQHF